jgi:uncharacterized protein with HEPN domain
MQPEALKLLEDIQRSGERIQSFLSGRNRCEYDELTRSAVERQFEIMGEALVQLSRFAPDLAARIPEHRRLIAFRNILIHRYHDIDDDIVWEAAQLKLLGTLAVTRQLLAEGSP